MRYGGEMEGTRDCDKESTLRGISWGASSDAVTVAMHVMCGS